MEYTVIGIFKPKFLPSAQPLINFIKKNSIIWQTPENLPVLFFINTSLKRWMPRSWLNYVITIINAISLHSRIFSNTCHLIAFNVSNIPPNSRFNLSYSHSIRTWKFIVMHPSWTPWRDICFSSEWRKSFVHWPLFSCNSQALNYWSWRKLL